MAAPESQTPDISVIIPAFNEAASLPSTIGDTLVVLTQNKMTFELIIINDGSTDSTNAVMEAILKKNMPPGCSIRYLVFTRNFGKEAAVLAGYGEARGMYIGSLDADGQHPPEDFVSMVTDLIANPQSDIVIGVRTNQDHKRMGFLSTWFYRLNAWLGNSHLVPNGTDFRVMKRHVVNSYLKMNEHHRVNRDLIDWLGYPYQIHYFTAHQRTAGTPSYSLRKLIELAINGLVTSGTKPLAVLFPFGVFITVASLLITTGLLINIALNDTLQLKITWQGIALMVIIFFFGLVLSALGILGLYISRTFTESRQRPHFVINTRLSR